MSTSNPLLDGDALCAHIQLRLEEALKSAAEPLIKQLLVEVEEQVQKDLGSIACGLFKEYDVCRMANKLEIRVRLHE